MLKLLKFEFRRMFKSVFFWVVAGISFVWPIITALFYRFIFAFTFDGLTIDELFSNNEIKGLTWTIAVSFITTLPKYVALFTCLHLGRDYTDGIIRNKIIAGHSRFKIYGSYMLSQMAASTFFSVIYILSGLLGLTISGIGANVNGGEMFSRFATAIVVFLVMTVAFSVISLIFRKRALPMILCVLIALVSNGAGSVIGMYNTPSKACKDYIEIRHERYEELVDEGVLDDDSVEKLEEQFDKDHYQGTPWKIFHPIYVLSPLGFEGDYGAGGTSFLIDESGSYKDEIDFSSEFAIDGDMDMSDLVMILFSDDLGDDQSHITMKDLKHVDSMHMPFSTLNWIYIGKSLIWMLVIGGWGFIIFRKKNLF